MNAHTEIHQQPDVQAAIRILAADLDRKLALRSEARAARKAARLADFVMHIRSCHSRALSYHAQMMASDPGSADFAYYLKRYDEQFNLAKRAIAAAKVERDCRI